MPLVTCPHCNHEQIVRRELVGLMVNCQACGTEFQAVADGIQPKRLARVRTKPVNFSTVWQTGLLVGGILVVAGVLFYFIMSARKADRPDSREAMQAKQQKAEEEERQKDWKQANEQAAAALGAGVFTLILFTLISIVALLYTAFVLLAGGWVAKDAYARGMNGLGWAAFYYLFQLLSRMFVVVILMFPAMLFGVGILGMLFAEPAYWCGLFVYLYARRPGALVWCEVCRNKQLGYLSACPHCGHAV